MKSKPMFLCRKRVTAPYLQVWPYPCGRASWHFRFAAKEEGSAAHRMGNEDESFGNPLAASLWQPLKPAHSGFCPLAAYPLVWTLTQLGV